MAPELGPSGQIGDDYLQEVSSQPASLGGRLQVVQEYILDRIPRDENPISEEMVVVHKIPSHEGGEEGRPIPVRELVG